MNVIIALDEIISGLENYLEQYDKILIFNVNTDKCRKIAEIFLKSVSNRQSEKKYLLLLAGYMGSIENLSDSRSFDICTLSDREYASLMEIYRMYEFSDKITVISDDNNYPGIMNYLSMGILTENECIEALLG